MNDINPVELVRAANDNDGGFGGGNGWWIILLFLFLGWGNRGYGNGGAGEVGGDMIYPWMNQAQAIWTGFSQVQQDLCNGFAGVTAAITNGFANAETAATNRQMANMQQMFGLSQQFAECCCENRLATANLQADIAREACANRTAANENTQMLLTAMNNGFANIERQNFIDKIDAKNETIAQLRQQIQMQDLVASQNAQTAQILADNFAQTNALEQYLAPVPRPAYVVQNPNCCQQTFGCGCGTF